MEGLIWDEVPAQRKRKEEQFSFPVVTLSAIAKLGAGRKFSFNSAAQKELDIKGGDRISFGFSNDKTIAALRKAVNNQGFALTQTCTVSDKKTYEFLAKMFNLNTSIENHFKISLVNGLHILSLIAETETVEDDSKLLILEMNVGEISDEEDLSADLRGVPTAESFGIAPGLEEEEELLTTTDSEDEEESIW